MESVGSVTVRGLGLSLGASRVKASRRERWGQRRAWAVEGTQGAWVGWRRAASGGQ